MTKTHNDFTTHYVWDGNVLLHEWTQHKDEPLTQVDDKGEITQEIPEDIITWIFEEGSFIPMAKLHKGKSYSILTDHLGTPQEVYDEKGKKVWQCQLDIYGKVRSLQGDATFIPFRYQGQYEDEETNLYYNRFRYYFPESGTYITQDPIGLAGRMPNMYAYVYDLNSWIDPFGLESIFVNPKDVNFSQISINKKMSDLDGNPIKINDMIKKVKAANTKKGGNEIMESMKPIRVKSHKGQLVSLDNRRLYIARKAKSKIIPIEMITDVETFKQLTTRLRNNGLPNDGTKKIPTCG